MHRLRNKNIFSFSFNVISACFIFLTLNFTACTTVKNKTWKSTEISDSKYKEQVSLANEYLTKTDFQGTVLISKKNKIIFAKGYGTSDKNNKKNPQNTIFTTFETGSISKQMTAAAIMQLIEKGKISTSDKISKFFPDYKYGDEITIEMLLTMHSGLTDCINAIDEFFPPKIAAKVHKNQIANKELARDIVLENFYNAPLFTKPNSTFFYCNTDYYLLARIVEIVSGEPFEKYIQKNIFDKCGMTYSNNKFQKTDAKSYDYKNRYYSIPASLALGCGDINSNVLDLYKWNTLFCNGKVVSKKSFKQMIDTTSYGYGLYRTNDIILHGGNTNVFNAYNSYNLKTKVSVIVLVNKPINECNSTIIAEKLNSIFGFNLNEKKFEETELEGTDFE